MSKNAEDAFNAWLRAHSADAAAYFGVRSGRALGEFETNGFPLGHWPFVITPHLMSASTAAALDDGIKAIFAAVDVILREHFRHDPRHLADVLRLLPRQRDLYHVAADQDWASVARPDVVIDARGRPWIAELNAGTPLGGLGASALLGRMYRAWPDAAAFLAEMGAHDLRTMDRLGAQIIENHQLSGEDLVAIAYWGHEDDNMPPHSYRVLASELCRCGIPAVVIALEDLSFTGAAVTLDGRRVTALYRFFDESDGTHPVKEQVFAQVMAHIKDASIDLIGSFTGDIFINKAFLAIVSKAADTGQLPDRITAIVRAVLPTTRLVGDAAAEAAERRVEWVLKPADGCDGQRIVFGADTDQATWEGAITRAQKDDELWVLQRLVPSPFRSLARVDGDELSFSDYRCSTGAFFFGRTYSGGIRRCDATGRHNITPSLGAAQGGVLAL